MHILKKALIFSVLICSLGLNAHSASDDNPTFPVEHLRLIFTPQGHSNLVYHTLNDMDTNKPTAHVLTLRINSPVRTAPDTASAEKEIQTTMLLAYADRLVDGQPYFKLSHIVNQLISYREGYTTDWLRSASLHADVPDAIKGRILTAIGPVPVVGSPASSAAD
ncbi:MAG: hypothetical protein K2Q34_07765 [Alphaproteobacteria bacterium]|nr:hypothetical protein [Alphaproteobacteria bacterium]